MVAVTIPDFWAGVAAVIIVELLIVAVVVVAIVIDARGNSDQ